MPVAPNLFRGNAPDYQLCDIAGSRLRFRGPMPDAGDTFAAVLGGSETFGKYVSQPYPALLSDWLGIEVANLGVAHAGLSLFSEERVLLDIASQAEVTVFQMLGAQNMSNRLYSVHSRRNDRFLGASPALKVIYPTVDFAQINFTGHLLSTLRDTSESTFEIVVDELKWAWTQRMQRLLSMIRGKVVLLWLHSEVRDASRGPTGNDPWQFVDRAMLDGLNGNIAGIVEVPARRTESLDGMLFPEGERDAAALLPGPADHHRIAEALLPTLTDVLARPDRRRTTVRAGA